MDQFYSVESGTTTVLKEEYISTTEKANEVLGRCLPDGSVPIVLTPGRSCLKPCYIQVPTGCYAIVQRFGADIDEMGGGPIWSEGFHWAMPWVKVKYLVTKQNFVFDTPVKGCKTADNVSVTIDVAITLRIMGDPKLGEHPKQVKNFVYKLGPTNLAQQLRDAQEEAVRSLARSVTYQAVYGLRSIEAHSQLAIIKGSPTETGDKDTVKTKSNEPDDDEIARGGKITSAMKRALNQQFNSYGVEIVDVAITNVRLPPHITLEMQEKTTTTSAIAWQQQKQKNDMQLLKMNEEKMTVKQKKEEEQLEQSAKGVKACADISQELNTYNAETEKLMRDIKEKGTARLLEITTQNKLTVKKTVMEKEAILQDYEARTIAEVSKIKAERDAYVAESEAKMLLTRAEYKAQSDQVIAEAEGVAAKQLRAKRDFELKKLQLKITKNLSENKDVVVSGSSGDNLLAEMLVAQRQSQILLNVDTNSRKAAFSGR